MPKLRNIKTQWDLTPLLSGDDDPKVKQYRQDVTKSTDAFVKKWRTRNDYLTDPKAAKQALDELEAWRRITGNGNDYFYYQLRAAQDSTNAAIKAKENQSTEFMLGIINKMEFFWLRLGSIASDLQTIFLQDIGLQPYRHLLEKTFAEARFRLSEPEEKILLLKNTVAHDNWVKMLEDFLSKEERKVLQEDGSSASATQEAIMALTASKQQAVRKSAGAALNKLFKEYGPLAEVELNSVLANKKN